MTNPSDLNLPQRRRDVWHIAGPLGQIRCMAEWARIESRADYPNRETLAKIETNLLAALAALDDSELRSNDG